MKRPSLSIRWRLTLWNLLLLGTALVALGFVFYFGLRYLLFDAVDDRLMSQAAIARSALVFDNGLAVNIAPLSDDDEEFVRVWDASGNLVFDTSGRFDEPTPNPDGVVRAAEGGSSFVWLNTGDDDVRILAEPIQNGDEFAGVLEVGRETDAKESLSFAARTIAISIPAILLFAGAGGWWLAGRALNPIDRITRTAATIEERDLSRRIDEALPDDEVGRLAATFNAMLDRIEDAFSRQRRFTSDAAHELRTPLALMRSQIDVALQAERDPAIDQDTLEALGDDVDRLARMATSLLSLARSDAAGIQLTVGEIDLPDLLDLLAEQYAPVAGEARISIVLDTSRATIVADQDQIIQVLVNLLDNALRHSPGGTQITLGCRAGQERVRIWVADEGPGIPPEDLPHIFERFYRVESDRGRRRGGIGLGLSISKAIVEAHGGMIEIQSTPESGTIVTVSLLTDNAGSTNR